MNNLLAARIAANITGRISLADRKVYIAGPMTGLPEFNYPTFFAAEEYLRSHGAKVMNPAVLPKWFEHHGQKVLLLLDVDHVNGSPWVKTHGPLMT